MDRECPICSDHQTHVFFSDETALVRLSDEFACVGHSVISARRHVENVSDLTDDESMRFLSIYRKAERALLDLFEMDRVLAVKLGLAVPHLHIHLYPVGSAVTRNEVDRILARAVRVEPASRDLEKWTGRLRQLME